MRVALLFGITALVGCGGELLLMPELPPETKSALVLIEAPGRAHIFALDRGAPQTVRVSDEGDLQITVLALERSLAELALTPGPLESAAEGPGTPLPFAELRLKSAVRGHSSEPWMEIEENAPGPKLRLSRRSARDCLSGGGCLTAGDANGYRGCVLECPEPHAPEPPARPEPPRFTPCPAGWVEANAEQVTVCEPSPAGRLECPIGQLAIPGADRCQALGSACAQFASDLPVGRTILYVDPAAAAGGDGSLSAPFRTIAPAIATAGPDAIIALARGDYPEGMTLRDGLTVWGACPSQTRLTAGASIPALQLSQGHAQVRNLSTHNAGGLYVSGSSSELSIMNVDLSGPESNVVVDAGSLLADGLVIRGGALLLQAGARGDVQRLVSVAAGNQAVQAIDSVLHVRDMTMLRPTGYGIVIGRGHFSLERGLFEPGPSDALRATDAATASVSDLVIRGGPGLDGGGLYAVTGGRIDAARVWIEDVGAFGVQANAQGSLVLRDGLITDVASTPDRAVGIGAGSYASELELERVVLERSASTGVAVFQDGEIRLIDTRIDDTLPNTESRAYGQGIDAAQSMIHFQRVSLARNRYVSVSVQGNVRVDGSDVIIEDTLPEESSGELGRGMQAAAGTQVELSRVSVLRAKNIGLVVTEGATVRLFDVDISDTRASMCESPVCAIGAAEGVSLAMISTLELERFLLADNEQSGARLEGGSILKLRDGRIRGNAVGINTLSAEASAEDLGEHVLFERNLVSFFP